MSAPAEHETHGWRQVNEAAGSRTPVPPAISAVRDTDGPNATYCNHGTDDQAERPLRIALLGARRWSALGAAGCGSSGGGETAASRPTTSSALAGSPPPLAALHEQANELLRGGTDAYEKRIAALHGYPVVVNVWASWCGPCRFEFPTLQKLSARYGKRVAFLGVNSEDSDDAAETFLEETPVPYPSYTDPDQEIADAHRRQRGLPDTAFYDRDGELCLPQAGPVRRHRRTRSRHRAIRPARRMRKRIIERWKSSSSSPWSASPCCSPSCCCRPAACWRRSARSGWSPAASSRSTPTAAPPTYVGPALITLGVLSAVTFYFVARKVLAAHRDQPVRTGTEEMVGSLAEARSAIDPEGQVWIEGALWSARLAERRGPVRLGDRVRVEAVDGLTLVVRPEPTAAQQPSEGGS